MTIVAIANQKGGIGKTTTAAAFAAGLKQRGFNVLAVDVDPQGDLSTCSGANNIELPTVYELLKGECMAEQVIQTLEAFDIIPSNVMLAAAEQELTDIGKEQRLKERLESIACLYDYIVIDTPPALGVLTINAFTAADEIIIPTTAGVFAAEAIIQLHDTILKVRKYCNQKVKIAGILLTKFDPRPKNNRAMKDLIEQIAEYLNLKLYDSYIRASVVVEEAQTRQTDLFSYKGNSTVAQDYSAFIEEYLKGD